MDYSRRDFGKLTLAGLPAAAFLGTPLFGSAAAQTKPNSLIKGVQIGIITYSYGGMADQGGEATLKYVVDSGFNAIELMDGPAEQFAGRPAAAGRGGPGAPPAGGAGAGARAGGGPGGAPGGAPAAAPGARAAGGPGGGGAPGGGARAGAIPEGASYNGQPCASGRGPGGGGGGGGFGRPDGATLTPEQIADQQAATREAAKQLKDWRTSVSMDKFKALRKMYNDAGVTIYAYKSDALQKNLQTADEEWEYLFSVVNAVGATHTTMELPAGPDAEALLKKVSGLAEKHKVYVSYHTHLQGSMTAFDQALAISKANMIGVDLGHYVAGGNVGGGPVEFLEKHHDRMLSFHIKDRTLPEHCGLNLAWGTGETPIKEILQTVQKNKWTKLIPTIELEYAVPQGSDKVQEARKCLEYCRTALA